MAGTCIARRHRALLGRIAWVAVALTGTLALVEAAGSAARSAPDEQKTPAVTLPPDLGSVPADALGFVSLRLGELWNQDTAKTLRERMAREFPAALDEWRHVVGLPPGDIERITVVFPHLEIGPGPYPLFFVETARGYDRARVLANIAPDGKEEKRADHVLYAGSKGNAVCFLGERAYLASSAGAVRDLIERPAWKKPGRLVPALELAAGKHALVAAVNPEPLVREFADNLPAEAAAFKPLLRTELATLTLDLGETVHTEVRLSFALEEDARRSHGPIRTGLGLARVALTQQLKQLTKEAEKSGPEVAKFVDVIQRAGSDLMKARVRQQGTYVEITAETRVGLADAATVLNEAVVRVRQASERVQSQNNLRQLTIAMHNYAAANNNRFPAQALFSPDGKPLLSWRVLILPYIEQDALYKEFHLNEPWDSEHNKKLLARMPKVFAMPDAAPGATETHYVGPTGRSAFFQGKQGHLFPADFPDGLSNTIMLVEVPQGIPWTKPEDVPFDPDPKKPLPKLGGYFRDGFNVALCDGSTRFLRSTISDMTLRAAITRDGGEVLGDDF
jgi:hypothetical protein